MKVEDVGESPAVRYASFCPPPSASACTPLFPADFRPFLLVAASACPDGLAYALAEAFCLKYLATVDFGDMSQEDAIAFVDALERRISDGNLYGIVRDSNEATEITGLGNPGAGVDSVRSADPSVGADDGETSGDRSEGLSGGAIFRIIVVIVLVPAAALYAYSRHQEQQKVQLDFHDGRSFVPPEHAGFGIEAYKHEFHSGDVTKEICHSVAEQLRLGLQY